jgi:hypothetical protein
MAKKSIQYLPGLGWFSKSALVCHDPSGSQLTCQCSCLAPCSSIAPITDQPWLLCKQQERT